MKNRIQFALAAAIAFAASTAGAFEGPYHDVEALRRAQYYRWHYNYYDSAWGSPAAFVVPPTAEHQTRYSWGVPSTRVTRIDHQFQRPYPGGSGYGGGGGFYPTPYWPSDTRQFGYYPVRGPW